MEVKKKFKLIDDKKEEAFLNDMSQKGYLLDSYDGKVFKFKKSSQKFYYLIEFFYKELTAFEKRAYEKKGYKHLYTFKSAKNGYYYYFARKEEVEELDRNLKDRYKNLLETKTRVDRFTSVIFVSTFSLFTFLYFKSKSEIYIIILLLVTLLGGYFGHIYIETIKKLSNYSKILLEKDGDLDGDNEGRSE